MVHKPKKFSLPIFPIPMGIFNYGKDNHNLNKGLVDDILTEVKKDSEGKVSAIFSNSMLYLTLFVSLYSSHHGWIEASTSWRSCNNNFN